MAKTVSTLGLYYFSPDVPNIQRTGTEEVTFSVSAFSPSGGEFVEIFSTVYYPANGTITFYDLRDIVETYMLENDLKVQLFQFAFGDYIQQSTIIYSRSKITGVAAADFVTNSFLTSQFSRLTKLDAKEYLYFYEPYPIDYAGTSEEDAAISLPVTYRIMYKAANGEVCTHNISKQQTFYYGFNTFTVIFSRLLKDIAYQSIMFVRVTVGSRTCSFYLTEKSGQNRFYFKNLFNCFELAIIPSSTTTKTETDSATATCLGELVQYDIEHKQTFEVQTAELLLSHAKWLIEMMTSPDIRLFDTDKKTPGTMTKVIIVDYDSELNDAPGEACSVKFEWQYATGDMITKLGIPDAGIFTEQYTPEFE